MRHSLITGLVVKGLLLGALFSLTACAAAPNPLESRSISETEKISTLARYLKFKTPVEAAEFSLFDVNRESGSLPGPTSRDYKVFLRVSPAQTELWAEGMMQTSFPHSLEWLREILPEPWAKQIQGLSFRQFYQENPETKKTLWIHPEEGIVVLRIIQNKKP